jgi:DNA-binding NtrC family response regulator
LTPRSRGPERKNDVARVEGDFPEDISSIQSQSNFERELKVEKDKKENIKVLLVDDEEEFVRTLSERIQLRDIGSKVVLDGEKAVESLEEEIPDVMVLDLKMPGMNGIEVLKKVKEAYPQVKVVMLTGHGSEKDEEEARKLGAFDYLQKPSGLERIIDSIKKAYWSAFDTAVATTFAEAGEYETARKVMEDTEKKEKPDD